MTLLRKIRSRQANIGVIGLGYVGLPLVIEFCKAGFPVTGFDIDPKKVESLKKGRSYIKHIDISPIVDSSSFVAHSTILKSQENNVASRTRKSLSALSSPLILPHPLISASSRQWTA